MLEQRAAPLIGAAGAVAGAVIALVAGLDAVGLTASIVVGAALAGVRRHPSEVAFVAAAALAVMAPFDVAPLSLALLAAGHAFAAGRSERRWAGPAALVALVGALELGCLIGGDNGFVPFLLIPAAAFGAGRALREREVVATQLAQRARELEDEREAHAALSVRYERARIASELHDIVAHAISVMVVQASAGQRLAARDQQATAETFDAIADAARQAEQDMGRLVALLGDEDAAGPAPDIALVKELVGRAAGSGLNVTLRLEGDRENLPAPLVEAAYRVVQEGLTNALRYAAGATVGVTLTGGRETLEVAVENGPAGSDAALAGTGTGNGLRGLRERVGACGGRLDAGPTAGGGWRLAASLPRRVGAVAD